MDSPKSLHRNEFGIEVRAAGDQIKIAEIICGPKTKTKRYCAHESKSKQTCVIGWRYLQYLC